MSQDARKAWRKLCREAIEERNPDKLMEIVTDLNQQQEEQEKQKVATFLQEVDKKVA
jgi:hypothetical protein